MSAQLDPLIEGPANLHLTHDLPQALLRQHSARDVRKIVALSVQRDKARARNSSSTK
jgi:hypothetical protein